MEVASLTYGVRPGKGEELAEGEADVAQRLAEDEQHVHELRKDDRLRPLRKLVRRTGRGGQFQATANEVYVNAVRTFWRRSTR